MLRLEMHGTEIPNAGTGETATTVGALATPALLLGKDRLDRISPVCPLVCRAALCCVPI
jgi:hypothetical protein